MPRYELIPAAQTDLLEIWNYTADTWGTEQADHYLRQIDACFAKIAAGKLPGKRLFTSAPSLKSVHCEHHYVFFLAGKTPTILAIFHEKMDCIARLKHRLAE